MKVLARKLNNAASLIAIAGIFSCGLSVPANCAEGDWPNLGKYREDDARIALLPADKHNRGAGRTP